MPLSEIVVQSNVVRNYTSQFNLNPAVILNLGLAALCAIMVLYYILWANGLAASSYRVSTLRQEISQLTETNSALLSEKTSMEDPNAAMNFAQREHMVPAGNVSYVFENGSVALQR